jgi:Na+-transporting NADH:ubiquinone oxidoreductase subunit NqrC
MNDSITKTLRVAFVVCLVCSLVVSSAVSLEILQKENKFNDQSKRYFK